MPCVARRVSLSIAWSRSRACLASTVPLALAAALTAVPVCAQPSADTSAAPARVDSTPSEGAAAPVPAAFSLADTTAAPAPPVSSLADTTRPVMFLHETLVTGARYPRAYYESPQALSFVSRAQLRALTPNVLGDALSTLPGVDMSKDSPWEQRPILRGLGGQRVVVLMDGCPVNSARGNGPHPSLVDPSQVERIEVVRGPSSVAYGSDALGGAINIITREAPLAEGRAFRGAATLGGSSVDRQRNGNLELMPRLGKLAAYLSAGNRRALNYVIPTFGRLPHSGFRDWNALANLRYPLTGHMTLRGRWQLYRGSAIGLPGLKTDVPGFLQEFSFPDYDRDAASLSLTRENPDTWLARAHATLYWQRERRNFYSHQEVDTSAFFPPPGVPFNAIQFTNQDRHFDLNTLGLQAQVISRRGARSLLSGGVDVASDRTDGDNIRHRYWDDAYGTRVLTGADKVTASVPDGTFASAAAFAQSEWFLDPRLTVNAGARLTHYRYRTRFGLKAQGSSPATSTYFQPMRTDDNALSGSLGVVLALRPDLHATANVANGYRQPNAQDLFFDGPASVGTVLGNPALKPEKSVSFDLGLRWGPGDVGLAGNLFYSTFDDLIEAIQVVAPSAPGAPATYQYVNIASARTMGGEFEGEVRFLRRYEARLSLAAAIGDITNAAAILELYGVAQNRAPLPDVPPFKGTAAVRWRDASGRVWVEPSARWSWRTNRLPLPTPGVPAFSTFKKEWLVGDVMVGARLPRGQKLVAGVRNIGNRVYRQSVGSLDEPGRSFVGSLTVEF